MKYSSTLRQPCRLVRRSVNTDKSGYCYTTVKPPGIANLSHELRCEDSANAIHSEHGIVLRKLLGSSGSDSDVSKVQLSSFADCCTMALTYSLSGSVATQERVWS